MNKLEKAIATLHLITTFKGKTLLGEGRYDEGANAAFEQVAAIAESSLKKIQEMNDV